MDSRQEYTPRAIRHISLTIPRRLEKKIPNSQRMIILRPGHTLTKSQIALIGTRMLDLRPLSVCSTVLSSRDFISIIIYITEGITDMDLTVFAYNPSYPQTKDNPKHLIHTQVICYTEIIPLLDAAMSTVLQSFLENPRGIWS